MQTMAANLYSQDDLLPAARRCIDRLGEVLARHESELSTAPADTPGAVDGLAAVRRVIDCAQRVGVDAALALQKTAVVSPSLTSSLPEALRNE